MIETNNNSYTPKTLEFSPSKLFFQHQRQILQKFEFISTMSIDTYFKYTFQEVQSDYFIEGGEFEGLNVDHEVVEQGIIYKIGFLNPKFKDIEHLLLDLKKNPLDNPSLWPLFLGLFGWLVIFFILLWFSKYSVGRVLFWLNLIGALILLAFYGLKKGKALYKRMVEMKNADYGGFVASYNKQSDTEILSTEVVSLLKELSDQYRITKFGYTGNCIYLLQDIHDREGNRLDPSAKIYSEQEKATLQQRTLEYLHQGEFLSKFMK